MSTHSQNERKVRIELTSDQQARLFASTGKQAEAIELDVAELEERIAPRINLRNL